MSTEDFHVWQEQNREYLALAIDELRLRMDGGETDKSLRVELAEAALALEALTETMAFPPSLAGLVETFDLGPFERDLVLLLAGFELDPRLQTIANVVTVGYALEVLPGSHWGAFDTSSPLRRSELIYLEQDAPLTAAQLKLADDIVRYLLGFDPRADSADLFRWAGPPLLLLASRLESAQDLARTIALGVSVAQTPPAVEIHGATEEDRYDLAELCAQELGGSLAWMDSRDMPPAGAELEQLLGRWNRCGPLTGTLLLISGADDESDPMGRHRVSRAFQRIRQPFFLSVRRPSTIEPTRPLLRREAQRLTADERAQTWASAVEEARQRLGLRQIKGAPDELLTLSTQFRVGTRTIAHIVLEAEALQSSATNSDGRGSMAKLLTRLREGCWRSIRAAMDPLAERLPLQDVGDVFLPDPERRQLDELERQIRLSHLVEVEWGLARGRDSGITALFAGPSGTGKTYAAMALARRLGLDLYRINVAAVLSKYIGETEQNLDRIFEASRTGGVILLFDEADALFGKRTEVKDAHDRYANLGTAYLLQRVEAAPTPIILTTNLKEGLDPAFTRRLHFVIDFPFPDEEEREAIWQNIFPARAPTRGLVPAALSQLAVTGGTISNIARRAAFLAATDGHAVEMRHVRAGALSELRKLDQEPLVEETASWE